MPEGPKVGAKIRRARKLLRLTQQQAADKIGVSRSAYDAWENDRSYPARYDVAIEQALGISLNDAPDTSVPSGPLDDLLPAREEWEQLVFDDPDVPADIKRRMITDWRNVRSAARARRQRRQDEERATGAG